MRLVDWSAPTVKKDFMEALENDAAARLEWKPVGEQHFESAVSELVAQQALDLYAKPLHNGGKAELIKICERLQLDPGVPLKNMTAKAILMLLLSVILVRVLPTSL